MFKPLIIAAAFVAATAAQAAPVATTFTNAGQTYTYSTVSDTSGRIVVTGHNVTSNISFRYVIDGQQVTGFTGDTAVDFRIAKPIALNASDSVIAAR